LNSLRSQLIVQVFVPLFALASILMWFSFSEVERLLTHRLEKEIELVARAMRVPLEQALLGRDQDGVGHALNAVFDIDRVYGAFVYDSDGRRVAAVGEIFPGRREQLEAVQVVAQGEPLGRYAEFAGEEVFSYFVPLVATTGQIDGLLQVVRRKSDMTEWLDRIRLYGWSSWIAVVVLMILVLIYGHRLAVVRPVERLLQSMQRVESGDRQHRAELVGPHELASLARGLNRMLDGLDQMQQALDRQKKEHAHMNERLREQENLAALGRFSAGVAHELGAPLSVIDADARRLIAGQSLDDDAQRRLGRMRDQVDRTRQLLTQLMDFVRAERIEPEAVPLAGLLRHVAAAAHPQLETHGISLDQPDIDDGLSVSGHRIRLEHALINLLRNAIQAARSRVSISAASKGDSVVVRVEDDGEGVPDSLRKDIFEPFTTGRAGEGGTGLGLAIVRTVADEHNALIEVTTSERLGGSCFEMIFGSGQ